MYPSSLRAILLLLLPVIHAQCAATRVDGPRDRNVTQSTFFLEGRVPTLGQCSGVPIQITSEAQGVIGTIDTFDSTTGRYRVEIPNQRWGTDRYELIHPTITSSRSGFYTITVMCGIPIIDEPVVLNQNLEVRSNRPTISGRSDCAFVTIEIPGLPSVKVQTTAAGTFSVRSQYLERGSYAITAVADSYQPDLHSATSETKRIRVTTNDGAATCNPPVITSHKSGDTSPNTFFLTGLVDVGSACDTGQLRIMSRTSGLISTVPTDGSGSFAAFLNEEPFGQHQYYVMYDSDVQQAYLSSDVTITVVCDAPYIFSPRSDVYFPPESLYIVTVPSSRPVISGYSNCPYVAITVGAQQLTASVVAGEFSVKWEQLRNGLYPIVAIAAVDQQGTYSSPASQRNMMVESTDPYPTGGMQRRASLARSRCGAHEESCPFIPVNTGKKQKSFRYECISNTSSNLERCGSCSGPDCSSLPNVSGVSCEKGICKIHSCIKGYYLVNRACVRAR